MLLPSPVDLTTLARVKSYTSATGQIIGATTGFDDDNIQLMITAVSRMIMRRTGNYSGPWQVALQSPWVQPVVATDNYSGSGSQEIYTRIWPIQSVQSLSINNVQVPASAGFGTYGYSISDDGKRVVLLGGTSSRGYTSQYFLVRGNNWPSFLRSALNIVLAYTAGMPALIVTNELQTIPATAPYTIAVDVQPWLSDGGVRYFVGGAVLTPVLVAPAAGQYYIQSPGVYLFNAADEGKQVQISYTATGCPEDLAWAACATVAYNYRKKGRQGLKSEQLMGAGGGMNVYSDLEIPPEAMGTVLDYKRVDTYPL